MTSYNSGRGEDVVDFTHTMEMIVSSVLKHCPTGDSLLNDN